MKTQAQKAAIFEALHTGSDVILLPNPWDIGSATMLEAMGFEALATTSSGFAQTLGRRDGAISIDEKHQHCADICANTNIPVTADLENCFGDSPEAVAACIERLAGSGIVGGSVEDYSGNADARIYDFSLSVERVYAAVEAADCLSFKFMLTARAENLLRSVDDIEDTIKRLQAYEAAGADVLYAPALKTPGEVRLVADSVTKPLNVLGTLLKDYTVGALGEAGAKRISTGGGLARLAASTLIKTGTALRESGSLTWAADILPVAEIDQFLQLDD